MPRMRYHAESISWFMILLEGSTCDAINIDILKLKIYLHSYFVSSIPFTFCAKTSTIHVHLYKMALKTGNFHYRNLNLFKIKTIISLGTGETWKQVMEGYHFFL